MGSFPARCDISTTLPRDWTGLAPEVRTLAHHLRPFDGPSDGLDGTAMSLMLWHSGIGQRISRAEPSRYALYDIDWTAILERVLRRISPGSWRIESSFTWVRPEDSFECCAVIAGPPIPTSAVLMISARRLTLVFS